MRTYQGTLSVQISHLTAAVKEHNVIDPSSPARLQNLRAVRGGAGDHLFRWERLFHLIQQPALA